jgi:3',5'-cyclic AMP phosphodiesterase CpdA
MSASDGFDIVHISDVHLSFRRPFFHHNWELLLEILQQATCDLVLCSGDMTVDGADCPEELAFAAEQFRRTGREILFVPGNHDIGNSSPDSRGGESLITRARRDAYLDQFGPDFWVRDLGTHWRLLGLNSMLFGSGLPAEEAQTDMIERAVEGLAGRKLLVMQHKPLYMRTPDEAAPTQSALYAEHRQALHDLLRPAGTAIVLSGHIHDYKTAEWDGIQQVWAPSTAFVIDASGTLYPRHGIRRVGYLRHRLEADSHCHEFVEPDSFLNIDLGNWMRSPKGFHHRYGSEPLRGLALRSR